MKQPFIFEQDEAANLAENACALFSWLKEDEVQKQLSKKQLQIPPRVLLVSSAIVASGLPILLDKYLPNGGCWAGGGCIL